MVGYSLDNFWFARTKKCKRLTARFPHRNRRSPLTRSCTRQTPRNAARNSSIAPFAHVRHAHSNSTFIDIPTEHAHATKTIRRHFRTDVWDRTTYDKNPSPDSMHLPKLISGSIRRSPAIDSSNHAGSHPLATQMRFQLLRVFQHDAILAKHSHLDVSRLHSAIVVRTLLRNVISESTQNTPRAAPQAAPSVQTSSSKRASSVAEQRASA